jgi:putative endonuclease
MAYTYILECNDGTYYTGSTKNLQRRLRQHQTGKGGAKYTRGRAPVTLVYFEEYESVTDAYRREKEIQRWTRKKKKALIQGQIGIHGD